MAVSTDHLSGLEPHKNAAADHSVRSFVSMCPSAVLVLDGVQAIVLANEICAELMGATSPDALIGRDLDDFVDAASRAAYRQLSDDLASGSTATVNVALSLEKFGGDALRVSVAARQVQWQTKPAILAVLTNAGDVGDGRHPGRMIDDGAEQRLKEAIETMSEGFALFDADRRLVLFNENYRRQIWPRLADFIKVGVSFEDIVRETLNRNVWEASGVDTDTLLQQAISRHEDVPSLHEIQYPDGRCIQQSKRRTADGGIVSVYSDITQLKRREAEISETQDRHRRLLETLPDGVVIHSGGKFAYLNPAAIKLLGGRTHTDLIGRNSDDFMPAEDQDGRAARLEKVIRGQSTLPPEEQRRIRLDGRIVNVEVRDTFIFWNGKPAVLTVLRDLTERKRAEFALRETERRYLTVAGNLPGAVYQRVMYPDGTIVYPYLSRGVIETHGVDAEDVKRDGSLLPARIHPGDRERFAQALKVSAEDQSAFDIEVRNIKPDGKVVWVRSLARSRKREDGAVVWDGLFVDITGRKQAEERAAQAYRWLTEAIESLSDGFALWDENDRLVLWNDQFISGHPQRDAILKAGVEFSTLVEQTAVYLRTRMEEQDVADWVVNRLQQHQDARGTIEVETPGGRHLLVTERRTNEGYTVGIYTDITERKRAEAERHASEERYERLVQVSPDAILVDRGGVIVFANETAASMIGVDGPDALIGSDAMELAGPEDRFALASRRSRLIDGQPTSFERFRYVRRDGEFRHCESAVSRITWGGEPAVLVIIRDVEERVNAERQQALFGAVLDSAADSIEIADSNYGLTYVNPAFERMTGYRSDEVLGKKPGDLFRPAQADPEVYEEVERALSSGKQWAGRMRALRRDGTVYDQEVSISPVLDAFGNIENFVAIKRDISERVETDRVLTEIEERYRKLLALTPDAVYVHVDAKVVLANDAALRVFGAESEEEILGASIFDLMHSEVVPIAEAYQRQSGDTVRMEQKRRRLDGEEFWASVSVTPLNWKGERGALVILTDITEQRRAQNDMIRAMEEAEIANKSKSEFLANMSHELRTPLNAIIGFSEIMRNEMFGEIGNEHYSVYARDIHESGMHLLYVINDILDLSKIEAGKLSASLADVVVSDIIDASIRLVRKSAADADIDIELRLSEALPKIRADQRMLKQMLMNLLSNAIKFAPQGANVRVTAKPLGTYDIEIAVVDSGVGIASDDLSRVLEPFIQADHPVEPREPGTGLGLPLTKSLAELHGGSFRLWSKLGLGTRAVICLPVSPDGQGSSD